MRRLRLNLNDQRGFVLPLVVVFVVVLSLTAYLVSHMTRTNIQVVRNIENEKAAFYIAEAGIAEALLRLRVRPTANSVTRADGLTFNPDIVPVESPPWNWEANITFTDSAPVPGTPFVTPTIQDPGNTRLPYSDVTGGESLLRIAWEMNGATPQTTFGGRNVLSIESTGRVGNARRTVVVHAIKPVPAQGEPDKNLFLGLDCSSVELTGNANVELCGGMALKSACDTCALSMSNNTYLEVPGGIDIVGNYCAPRGDDQIEPDLPNTGAEDFEDPYKNLEPLVPTTCDYTTRTKETADVNGDGMVVYCGGFRAGANDVITFTERDYVIAGGVFDVSGSAKVSGNPGGVTFHVGAHPTTEPIQWGAMDFGPGEANLFAPPSDPNNPNDPNNPYAGILIYQHRDNTKELLIRGTFNTGLSGIIYAPAANVSFQNQTNPGKDLDVTLVVGSADFVGDNALGCSGNEIPPTDNGFDAIAWQDWPS